MVWFYSELWDGKQNTQIELYLFPSWLVVQKINLTTCSRASGDLWHYLPVQHRRNLGLWGWEKSLAPHGSAWLRRPSAGARHRWYDQLPIECFWYRSMGYQSRNCWGNREEYCWTYVSECFQSSSNKYITVYQSSPFTQVNSLVLTFWLSPKCAEGSARCRTASPHAHGRGQRLQPTSSVSLHWRNNGCQRHR